MNTTQEIIQQRKTNAITAINAELWRDAPAAEKMADAAIRGGLSGEEVAALEVAANAAKTTLAELAGIDLPALQSEAEKLAANAKTKQAAASQAQAKADAANDLAFDAAGAVDRGRNKYQLAAGSAMRGEIPVDKLPDTVRRIMAFNEATSKASELENRFTSAKHEVRRLEGMLQDAQRDQKTANTERGGGSQIVTTAGLQDAKTATANTVKRITAALKATRKSIPELERAAADALKAKDAARTAITAERKV